MFESNINERVIQIKNNSIYFRHTNRAQCKKYDAIELIRKMVAKLQKNYSIQSTDIDSPITVIFDLIHSKCYN
jgi:hypothetical protein